MIGTVGPAVIGTVPRGAKADVDAAVKAVVIASAEFATESPEPGLDELYTDIYA